MTIMLMFLVLMGVVLRMVLLWPKEWPAKATNLPRHLDNGHLTLDKDSA